MRIPRHPMIPASLVAMMVAAPPVSAGLSDLLEKFSGKSDAASAAAGLSQSEALEGLRTALRQGVSEAVRTLGREDGFLGNPSVRIPMPDKLSLVEKGLRRMGRDDLADSFVESMNRAAERAVPAAAEVFSDAISGMSVDDAVGIVNGGPTAGTDYLERTSADDLAARFRPIVSEAMDRVGVTRRYQDLLGGSGTVGRFLGDDSDLDLTNYVTGEAMDGIFAMVAAEEQRIRENPAARGAAILQRVFGR